MELATALGWPGWPTSPPWPTWSRSSAPSLEYPVVLVGPEGGWSPEERTLADELGVPTLELGPYVLRTDTAAIAAGVRSLRHAGLRRLVDHPPRRGGRLRYDLPPWHVKKSETNGRRRYGRRGGVRRTPRRWAPGCGRSGQKRLSLDAVEELSKGEFKASVLGAYERGERAVSVPRLARLAAVYEVPVDLLLPADDEDGAGGANAGGEDRHRPGPAVRARRALVRDAVPLPADDPGGGATSTARC